MWQPIVSFVSREVGDKWNTTVLAALRQAHPEVFTEAGPPERFASAPMAQVDIAPEPKAARPKLVHASDLDSRTPVLNEPQMRGAGVPRAHSTIQASAT